MGNKCYSAAKRPKKKKKRGANLSVCHLGRFRNVGEERRGLVRRSFGVPNNIKEKWFFSPSVLEKALRQTRTRKDVSNPIPELMALTATQICYVPA